jgi:hypothetical protein
MAFYQNKTKTNNSNLQLSTNKTVFKETLNYIDKKWDEWNNKIIKYEEDCNQLDRMFTEYNRDQKFLELKYSIFEKIKIKKQELAKLEQFISNIKINIELINN